MTRARATALALVNWKGVFYERYLLDRHVTVLEGANGAGKTTVMIAAYVALLPDMGRLRFTNLGESGATGGDRGIWGRLGEPGRPSYVALEIENALERVVAGVRLERKAEPTVELTPFIITGVDFSGRLRDVLLRSDGEHDEVPDLADVRAAVVARGGALTVFSTAKEYFSNLFDRGLTPLRLTTEEDRHKMNEMLRTSMTGGISRALTTELRAFLLKEETGLADTLGRMRKNLDTCHRTRTEVRESRELEQEISGVFDAAQAMAGAAVSAARERARDLEARATAARDLRDARARDVRDLERQLADVRAARDAAVDRATDVRTAIDAARERRALAMRADELSKKLADLAPTEARARDAASTALALRDRAAADKQARREARDAARAAYDRAAYGVGDLQAGLDELHKQVHAKRLAARRLAEVRELLGRPSFDEPDVDATLASSRARLTEIDAERARADRAARSSVELRERYDEALAALRRVDADVTPENAYDRARSLEARFAELEVRARRVGELATLFARHTDLTERQARVRARAAALGLDVAGFAPESAATRIERAVDAAEADARRAELTAREHERRAVDARRAAEAVRTELDTLESMAPRWAIVQSHAAAVAAHTGSPIVTRNAALEARLRVAEEIERQRASVADQRSHQEELLRAASELESAGGAFHPDLLRLRDELDAELLAGRFDELDPKRAAELEAELGPLANALIVEDPHAAARALAGAPRELSEVWLIRPDAPVLSRERRAEPPTGDLVIEESFGVRIARMPARPSIGRLARERRAAELRAQAEQAGREIDETLANLQALEAVAVHAGALVADAALLEAEDPAIVGARLRDKRVELDAARVAATELFEEAEEQALAARTRSGALRALLGEAFLLDPPDHATEVAHAEAELAAARHARDEVRRTEDDRALVRERLDVLREPPIEPAEVERLKSQRGSLDASRDAAFALVEALEELAERRAALRALDRSGELEEQRALAPLLTEQLDHARSSLASCEEALTASEADWEKTSAAYQSASAAADAVAAQVGEVAAELARLGLGEAAAEARVLAERAVEASELERARLEREAQRLSAELAQLEERRAHAERARADAEEQLAERERLERPARAAWVEIERRASGRFVATSTASARDGERLAGDAKSKAQVLLERARRAKGGLECATELDRLFSAGEQESGLEAPAYLDAWEVARSWIAHRLPGQLAEQADPAAGLGRLRDNLELLERRLERQEADLRGTSEDVARGIDVRLSRARAQVRRLNQSLSGVRFGNITGIRVEMRRVERMDAVLKALRQGDAQELLFQTNLPIEEALDELFRRYGGGRSGGQKVLDYREYAELIVEIQRSGEDAWELASPTRLSTGEAIGVGAALMMVVLTEWERDGNLLRAAPAPGGSLRFLFLDEANRLSQDNLGVLFSLCQNLDLQLLIAAPEVARAEGNTTYRLVRRIAESGKEEVIVSGRRVAPANAQPAEPPTEPTPELPAPEPPAQELSAPELPAPEPTSEAAQGTLLSTE